MQENLLQQLKIWRIQSAQRKGVELFRILPNKVIDEIARLKPTSKEGLIAIKGIQEKKFQEYGREIIEIVKKFSDSTPAKNTGTNIGLFDQPAQTETGEIFSVSQYLDVLNDKLFESRAIVQGEVSSLNFRNGHAYFAVKDKTDESLLNCFMWANNYALSGVELQEGLEVLIHGVPEIYKPYGKLSFKTELVELVGEGALKKAYEELKNRLEEEGLFDESRKRKIPNFPHRIGLVTSRDGAVINDFMSNIGQFGYEIIFMDSRVEGAMAINDLLKAIDYFSDQEIDLLVIIRGGGSLESLQAFNNENLVRKIANFPRPVICGIGHDKDEPLANFVADLKCSTPSIVASSINKSWERAKDQLTAFERTIFFRIEESLSEKKYFVENKAFQFENFYREIFDRFEKAKQKIKINGEKIKQNFSNVRFSIDIKAKNLKIFFEKLLKTTEIELNNFQKSIRRNNPERQLELGYSLIRKRGKLIRSVNDLGTEDEISVFFKDGQVESEVKKIIKH